MNKKNLFKFLTFFLVLVISFCITKIPTSAGKIITDNGTNYDTLTLSGTDLVGTQTAYVVKNQITKFTIKGTNEIYSMVTPNEMYYDKVDGYFYVVEKGSTRKGSEADPAILKINKTES